MTSKKRSEHETSMIDRFGYQWGTTEMVITKNGKKCKKN